MATIFNDDFRDFILALNKYEEGLMIRFIHLNNLIQAKKAAGRYKDLDDIEKLTQTD